MRELSNTIITYLNKKSIKLAKPDRCWCDQFVLKYIDEIKLFLREVMTRPVFCGMIMGQRFLVLFFAFSKALVNLKINMKKFIAFGGVAFVVALVTLVGAPAASLAADYAYVNTSGAVNLFVADNANIALANAPFIGVHSGVMLLDSTSDYAGFGINK